MSASWSLYQQLEADFEHHLPTRGWHEFLTTYNRAETFQVITAVLHGLGIDATIVCSPVQEDGVYFYIAAVPDDDTAPDYRAARELLCRIKKVEQVDRELFGDSPETVLEGDPAGENDPAAAIDVDSSGEISLSRQDPDVEAAGGKRPGPGRGPGGSGGRSAPGDPPSSRSRREVDPR